MTEHTEITEQTENDFFIVDCDLMSDAHTPTRSVHNLWAQIRVHSWLIFSVISVISVCPVIALPPDSMPLPWDVSYDG